MSHLHDRIISLGGLGP